ncbi:MAG: cytosolic protein [Proteobacteria bacterium]|nr:cytosolic protein [Pseudomonadota bacterium]
MPNSAPLMKKIDKYISSTIATEFHDKRLAKISEIKLSKIVGRKNPYLLRAKNCLTAHDAIKSMLEAVLSSSEETIFGNYLEKIAIYVCEQVFHGRKSGIKGIDLEFEKNRKKYVISIKSGPNWGSASQREKLADQFNKARATLRTSGGNKKTEIIFVEGVCYGKQPITHKASHVQYYGKDFWELISGNPNLYKDIIKPLGESAKKRNEDFLVRYSEVMNALSVAFIKDFCDKSGKILWPKLMEYVSKNRASGPNA